jgi:EAL domain-containing protein (putative c-di-GMP-specific phosphodiesterase class I)/GGDEF domain-containing protein
LETRKFSVEWFRMIGKVFLPHEWIKYFPPQFQIRDPFYKKIDQKRLKGDFLYIFLYDIKEFRLWNETMDDEDVQLILHQIQVEFKKWTKQFFDNKEILVFKQLWGDDFILVIRKSEEVPNMEQFVYLGRELGLKIEDQIRKNFPGLKKEVSFHFGYSPISREVKNVKVAVNQALYSAHAMAKKRVPPHYHNIRDDIRNIIAEERVKILVQPIVSLKGSGLEGYEILTRGPEGTIYYHPEQLFGMAKDANLLLSLELLVFRKAVEEVKRKQIRCPVFINITAYSLQRKEFYFGIKEILDSHPDISCKQFIFELIEREAIKDLKRFKERIHAFRELGFRFAVDDAGAGYSNLMVISELLPEIIKIDRSVITGIDQYIVKESMLHALLYIAKRINAKVVAEGIERREELELLLKYRVDLGQGFFFAHPHEYRVPV